MKRTILYLLVLLSPICLTMAKKKKDKMQDVVIGSQAPDFLLSDETGAQRSLSEFKGKLVILYFYPKDGTPGCTKQACAFRDSFDEFTKHGIVVLGINYETPVSHKNFKENYQLPFTLLSDGDRAVSKRYGTYASMLDYLFPKRVTFVIDQQGKVIQIFKDFDPASNASDILEYLKKNDYI